MMRTALPSCRMRRGALALLFVLTALLAGCNKQLFAQLSEADANDMLTVLLQAGIDAQKNSPDDGKTWSVMVDQDAFARAMEVLHSHGLPHEKYASLGDIFKKDGGRRTAELLATPFLGSIPLDPQIVLGGDAGVPIAVENPQGPHAIAFRHVAEAVVAEVERHDETKPRLTIV